MLEVLFWYLQAMEGLNKGLKNVPPGKWKFSTVSLHMLWCYFVHFFHPSPLDYSDTLLIFSRSKEHILFIVTELNITSFSYSSENYGYGPITCLFNVYECFYATMVKMCSWDKVHMAQKPKIFMSGPLFKNCVDPWLRPLKFFLFLFYLKPWIYL